MTAGIALPAFIFGYFGMLDIGISLSTGALCVSITDSAGPLHHRANGMFFCMIIIAVTAAVTQLCLSSVIALSAEILLFGFGFSMLSAYNARVASIGIAALLIMILSMQTPLTGVNIVYHSIYLLIGSAWYMIFSFSLHTLRPYKLLQQLSGEFITLVSEYLRLRAVFYSDHPDYDATYRALLQQQVKIEAQQNVLSEMLFKTRSITKNSTGAGRSLLKIYLDVSDLFESIMSTYQKYEVLHKKFDETGILSAYREQLVRLADELAGVASAVEAGAASPENVSNADHLEQVRKQFETLRHDFMSDKNVADFIALGRIFRNIRDLTEKIRGLHYYTKYTKSKSTDQVREKDLPNFNEAQTIAPALFLNNLNFKSNIFRHSLRVSISLLAGYIISVLFHIGHSYWILLTIVVILKPAYSLTKARNIDRLLGTLAGILIGVLVLFTVKNNYALLAVMVIFMAGGYMFMRTKYFLSVFLMTVYLVVFFHLIYPAAISGVLLDRLLDTVIGSGIAFFSSLFFIPAWEYGGIRPLMAVLISKNIGYYKTLSAHFDPAAAADPSTLRKPRQEALTALANLSDAFTRMLSEPKRFQKNTEVIYRFVVLNHILSSHFSALSFYINNMKRLYRSPSLALTAEKTLDQLMHALRLAERDAAEIAGINFPERAELQSETTDLLALRKTEIAAGELETETKSKLIAAKSVADQFSFIYHLSADMVKSLRAFHETASS